jgi:uncharacterized protein involved in response to NO
MTTAEAINRGYNLMVTAVLFFAGLAFGTVAIEEADLIDKVDDVGLLTVGAIAVIWYLTGDHRTRRSQMPVLLTIVALIAQLSAIVFERDDPTAFGDNIGGIIYFTPFVIFAIYQHVRNGRLQASS